MEQENGKITRTMLGLEDHGLFTYCLTIEGDGWGQGAGTIVLGGDWVVDYLRALLNTLEVEKWEDIKGKLVRIRRPGFNEMISEIGHIYKDKWFKIKPDLPDAH